MTLDTMIGRCVVFYLDGETSLDRQQSSTSAPKSALEISMPAWVVFMSRPLCASSLFTTLREGLRSQRATHGRRSGGAVPCMLLACPIKCARCSMSRR